MINQGPSKKCTEEKRRPPSVDVEEPRSNRRKPLGGGRDAPISSYCHEYLDYFAPVEQEVDLAYPRCLEMLRQQNIVLHENSVPRSSIKRRQCQSVKLQTISHGGAVATFSVRIGRFEIKTIVLNLLSKCCRIDGVVLGKGSFGAVLQAAPYKSGWVSKRIYFRKQADFNKPPSVNLKRSLDAITEDIEDALIEYGFLRVCSALGVGPYVEHGRSFDLFIADGHIEFLMERCEPINFRKISVSAEKFKHRISVCLRKMHRLHLLHKDIKPDNIMYSPYWRDYVLVDFGISKAVAEELGRQTLTYREGTKRFMSLQMHRLSKHELGYADLYYNDLNCLVVTLNEFSSPTYKVQVHPPESTVKYDEVNWPKVYEEAYQASQTDNERTEIYHQHVVEVLQLQPLNGFWNEEFIVRVSGVSPRIARFLEKCDPDSPKLQKLYMMVQCSYGMRTLDLNQAAPPWLHAAQQPFRTCDLHLSQSCTLLRLLETAVRRRDTERSSVVFSQLRALDQKDSIGFDLEKWEVVVNALLGKPVSRQQFSEVFDKLQNKQQAWWLLFHCVRLALERYQHSEATTYTDLLMAQTFENDEMPTPTLKAVGNKHDLVLNRLELVLMRVKDLEDEGRWWQLSQFLAKQLVQQGHCRRAADLCKGLLEQSSTMQQYHLVLRTAKAYNKINELQLALTNYWDCVELSRELFPEGSAEHLELLCYIADIFSHLDLKRRANETISDIEALLSAQKGYKLQYVRVYSALAMILVRLGRHQRAASLSEAVLGIGGLDSNEPTYMRALFYRGAYLYESACASKQKKHIEGALQVFTQCRDRYLLTRHPLSYLYHLESMYYIGMCHLMQRRHSLATVVFEECLQSSEGKCNGNQARVKSLYRMISYCKDDPVRLKCLKSRIQFILNTEEVLGDGFTSDFQKLVLKDFLSEQKNRVQLQGKGKVTGCLVEVLEKSCNNRLLNERQLVVMINIGKTLLSKERYSSAAKCFSIGYDRSPQCAYYIGLCLFYLGFIEKSSVILRDVIGMCKRDSSPSMLTLMGNAYRLLAEIAKHNQQPTQVEKNIKEALDILNDVKDQKVMGPRQHSIGLCYYTIQDFPEALKWFVRGEHARLLIKKSQQWGAPFCYYMGMCYSRFKSHRKCQLFLSRWASSGEENAQGFYHHVKSSCLLRKTTHFARSVARLKELKDSQHFVALLRKFLVQRGHPTKGLMALGEDVQEIIVKCQLQSPNNQIGELKARLKQLELIKTMLKELQSIKPCSDSHSKSITRVRALLKKARSQ